MQTTTSKISAAAPAAKASSPSLFRRIISKIAWLYDRFVFHVIYRGERLRPEVRERIEAAIEEEEREPGKNCSPGFTNVDDLRQWLDSRP